MHFMVLKINQGLLTPKKYFCDFLVPPQIHFWRKPDEWNSFEMASCQVFIGS
jgi:hypothetical protein